jgi:DNA-binding MarR family transcriptional regulator
MEDERSRLLEHILSQEARVYNIAKAWPQEWFSSSLTMPQLKILFLLYGGGAASMGELATPLGVKLSTVTGIVDRLVEQGLVERGEDPRDRRVVLGSLTDKGQRLVGGLYQSLQLQLSKVLEKLTLEDLRKVAEAFNILFEVISIEQQQVSQTEQSLSEKKERNLNDNFDPDSSI